jgi:PAS domain S-box-containing protein
VRVLTSMDSDEPSAAFRLIGMDFALSVLTALVGTPDRDLVAAIGAANAQIGIFLGARQVALYRSIAQNAPRLVQQWMPEAENPDSAENFDLAVIQKLFDEAQDRFHDLGQIQSYGSEQGVFAVSFGTAQDGGFLVVSASLPAEQISALNNAALTAITQGLLSALRRQEQATASLLLTEILETLEDGLAVYDADDRLLCANQSFAAFYPLIAPNLVSGCRFQEILHNSTAQAQLAAVKESADSRIANQTADNHSGTSEFERTLPDGRILHATKRLMPGGIKVELHSDITKMRLAEQRVRNLIEAAGICTWEWNVTTGDHRVNEHWAALLGYRLEELEPVTFDTWLQRVHPDDLAATEDRFNESLSKESFVYKAEYRLRHRDGHWVWVLDTGRTLLRGPDGAAQLIAGVQVDVSEQKARELALTAIKADLERSITDRDLVEKRLSDIASVSDGWLWEMNKDLRYSFIMDGEFFDDGGVPKDGLLGRTQKEWLDVNPDMQVGIEWDGLLAALHSRQPFRDFIYRAPKSPDGIVRWRRMTGSPIFDDTGTFTGYRGVGADVTELYLAKARAEEASHTKSMFLANMSHEIRTPLNGVLGMAEVLDGSLEQPDQKRMMRTIRRSGEALLNILNDILDMSKIEAGKLELETVPFNPLDLAGRVEDLHELHAEEKGLGFEVLIGSGVDFARLGDPLRVQQVLHNLISNAIKFTDSGEVIVKLSGRAGMPLVIEVRDTGIGMSPEQLLRLHEEFSQADVSVTRRFGGTGLGMAITRSLIEKMGGSIDVVSELGKGTTIKVSLPLPASTASVEPITEGAVKPVALTGLRLLAADDNLTNCAVLEMMLLRLGAEVTIVSDGAQAVEAWAPGRFDAVLLDIAMPVMNGQTALSKIRALEAAQGLPAMPILAVTANVMAHQVAEYISLGFDGCIGKPVSSADLSLAIGALVAPQAGR